MRKSEIANQPSRIAQLLKHFTNVCASLTNILNSYGQHQLGIYASDIQLHRV